MTANTSPASLSVADRARRLRELHAATEILRVVNVWDVIDDVKPLIASGKIIDPQQLTDPTVPYAQL